MITSRTAVIHQPDFLSYLGFFHRLLHCDVFVVLDTAQFVAGTSRSWMNRDKIKTPQGEKWLTVGVKKAPLETSIREVQLADTDWRSANLNLIRQNYRQAPYFNEIMPYLEGLYAEPATSLMVFNMRSVALLMQLFALEVPLEYASNLRPVGHKNELLVDLLTKVGARSYLSGQGARAYFVPEPFVEAEIEVVWQNFSHPVYPQLHGEFIPFLSSIDLLLNCGIVQAREILRSC